MGVRAVACAIVLGGLVFLGSSESVLAGCNPNLAWQDRYPSWAADRIAFQREQAGCTGGTRSDVVGTIPGSGTGLRWWGAGVAPAISSTGRVAWTNEFSRLVVDGYDLTGGEHPAWSPRGDRLAFLRGEALWVREMSSGQERRLAPFAVFAPFSEAHVSTPSWSPDGAELAFIGPGMKISVARADGSGVRKLTSGLDPQVSPAWSPDGDRIAFVSDRGDDWDVWSIRPDGTGMQRLTDRPVDETLPAWSPDGTRIAFVRATGAEYGEANVWLMGRSGGAERLVGGDAHGFSQPAWSMDGRRLVYASGRECLRWGLYVLNVASGAHERITNRCRYTGTVRDDKLRGTPFRDFLVGLRGDDQLRGLGGPDSLTGGPGSDVLDGDSGADTIIARDGRRDIVSGGPGKDSARVDRGLDRVTEVERLLP
jgi:WD40-like Beta Propeller Repeat/RTX calcium-binding nonapeptide repeat (4 copies)